MMTAMTKLVSSLHHYRHSFVQFSSVPSVSSAHLLKESIRALVESKTYQKIPELLNASKESCQNPNPFTFLSTYPQNLRTQIIDEILQDFIPLKPRSCARLAYSCLLSYTLQNPNPLPLALAILQRTLRSGCVPTPQTHLLLSSAWLNLRQQSHSVPNILSDMISVGYRPDCGTCNYVILSLCRVDQLNEAILVLRGMGGAGCIPDLDSYGSVIGPMCDFGRTTDAAELMKEMVVKVGLTPRQETVAKVVETMRANRDVWKGVEMIEFLEMNGMRVGFESYEKLIEGCLECSEFVLAGKVAMGMTRRGFIPYIRVRHKVVEGLASVGEWDLAFAVRHRFAELKS